MKEPDGVLVWRALVAAAKLMDEEGATPDCIFASMREVIRGHRTRKSGGKLRPWSWR